jgi:hypothetical protein
MLKIRKNNGSDIEARDKTAKEKALSLIALDFIKKADLLGRLDAFDSDAHV